MRKSKRGLTLIEIVIGMLVMVLLMAIAIPAFNSMLKRSQLDAAARQLMSDAREAQSRAALTSWQYRVIGFDINSTSAFKNQYRLVGRSSSAVAWPVETSPNFTSATQMAAQWVNLNKLYPNIRVDTTDATNRYWVSFDARGVAIEINSFPVQFSQQQTGAKQCLGVTTAGSLRMVTCP